jgi:hypothetical protein
MGIMVGLSMDISNEVNRYKTKIDMLEENLKDFKDIKNKYQIKLLKDFHSTCENCPNPIDKSMVQKVSKYARKVRTARSIAELEAIKKESVYPELDKHMKKEFEKTKKSILAEYNKDKTVSKEKELSDGFHKAIKDWIMNNDKRFKQLSVMPILQESLSNGERRVTHLYEIFDVIDKIFSIDKEDDSIALIDDVLGLYRTINASLLDIKRNIAFVSIQSSFNQYVYDEYCKTASNIQDNIETLKSKVEKLQEIIL